MLQKKNNALCQIAHHVQKCKCYIVFTPKYKRKMIYSELCENIQKRIKDLCKCKEIEIIKG
ncbi:MAG TPA: transposase [Candidatus Coprocola pullicola]|nr:transposase [Candidatus Coprocola pullicola]